jgi:hypothetical protein
LASSIVYPHLYGVHTIADDVSEYWAEKAFFVFIFALGGHDWAWQ